MSSCFSWEWCCPFSLMRNSDYYFSALFLQQVKWHLFTAQPCCCWLELICHGICRRAQSPVGAADSPHCCKLWLLVSCLILSSLDWRSCSISQLQRATIKQKYSLLALQMDCLEISVPLLGLLRDKTRNLMMHLAQQQLENERSS